MSSTQPSLLGIDRRAESNIGTPPKPNEGDKLTIEKGKKPSKISESPNHVGKERSKGSNRPSASTAKTSKPDKCRSCGSTSHSKPVDSVESDDSSTSDSDEDYSAKSHGSDSTGSDSETEPEHRSRKKTRSKRSAPPRHRLSLRASTTRRGNHRRSRSNSIAGREMDYQQYSDVDDNLQYVQPRQPLAVNNQNYGQYVQNLEQRCSQLQFQVDQANGRPSGLAGGYFPNQIPIRPLGVDYSAPPPPRGFLNPRGGGFIPGPPRPRHIPIQRGGRGPNFSQRIQYVSDDSYSTGPDNGSGAHKTTKVKPGTRLEYKRVDWVWDKRLYTFKLQDTAELPVNSEYDQYIFHIRRTFDSENKHRATFVDIKSKLLRECLQDVIGNVRGFNLVDETPKIDPNLLFLYLEDFRTHTKQLKKMAPAGTNKKERKKNQRRLEDKRKQLKVLVKYLDKDYAKIKNSLYPMLKSGIITFDFLWALWKPNTLVYSTSDDTGDDPRVFKVSFAGKASTLLSGSWYFVEGKCLEFDGKKFGHGTLAQEVQEFQGTRKITSLPVYPLKYHKDELNVRQALIERGKKFVELAGAHFKAYSGVAYMKRKKGSVVKFHIQQSRIMVDPATFRRVNPNYFLSPVRARDYDDLSDSGMDDDEVDGYEQFSSDGDEKDRSLEIPSASTTRKKLKVTKALKNEMEERAKRRKEDATAEEDKKDVGGSLATDSSGEEEKQIATPEADTISDETLEFSDEDYLISAPVVLGFAFSEKQWLEFSVSKVEEIKWNDTAWDSLVLEPETKDLIQALVKSRRHHASETIDDVIQGKGKGLVTVLHGPPGTGKTLTAEGISELLRCPLYMASAGELGTDPRFLEADLQKILDICHAWGAILLLDEADVFLEKRNMQDIHRNALVSIFLRQLEYFQGILFLTTNRVETFDDAFQSRIHIALRYESLDAKAKKTIFKMFIDRVEAHGKLTVQPFSDDDLNKLAKHELNGREIKNMVGSAQDLAVTKDEALSMKHIQQVLDIHVKFGRDLKGGTGYEEAMRSYC